MNRRGRSEGAPSVVGRESELARLDHFVREASSRSSMVLIGAPGIGKTTLWEDAVWSARERGSCVLAAHPSGSDARLPFAGLVDLCDHLGDADFATLPVVQRRALEAALLRAEPASAGPNEVGLVSLGLLGMVRELAARTPVLVAIDDLQWLDAPSADVLAFLARRIENARVGFLLARRPGPVGGLEAVLSRAVVERLQVGPLSFGAVRRLLFERLGLTTSRQLLRRVVDATGGNPLFALEVGRALLEDPGQRGTADLPLPDSLEEMLSERVSRMAPAVQRVLLTVALFGDPRLDQVLPIIEAGALDDAVHTGVVVVDGQKVRAAHPLLASAAEGRVNVRARREVHLAISQVVREEPERVMHLALASVGPDRALARRVAAEAEAARVSGSRREAALLAAQALRLTPPDAAERVERVLELAERLDDAGELRQMSVLLRDELPALPVGTPRARAWLALSEGDDVRSREDQDRYLDQALGEGGGDPNLRARVLAKKAGNAAAAGVSHLAEAEAWAGEALTLATDPSVRRYALWALAWPIALKGRPLDDLVAQSGAVVDPSAYLSASPERVLAKRLFWRGELASARELLQSLQALADDRGDLTSYAMVRMHMVEVELRSGDLAEAGSLLEEWAQSSDYETQFRPQYPRCRALWEVQRGAADDARRWADETIELARAAESKWDELEARRARGTAGLLALVPDQAVADLLAVWEHCEREGVLDPGVFPVAPDLVEALSELERFEEAGQVARRLGELAVEQDHPWASAAFKRCTGTLELATGGDLERGTTSLAEASVELEALGSRFDAARCVLVLGRAHRRLKQWRGARESLERAAASFAALGAEGWAARSRSELERVGGRRPDGGALTPSERQVSELAADGLSNKQIAAALHVTVNTVEVHLARAYAKLGVRSRGQLAKRLAGS